MHASFCSAWVTLLSRVSMMGTSQFLSWAFLATCQPLPVLHQITGTNCRCVSVCPSTSGSSNTLTTCTECMLMVTHERVCLQVRCTLFCRMLLVVASHRPGLVNFVLPSILFAKIACHLISHVLCWPSSSPAACAFAVIILGCRLLVF